MQTDVTIAQNLCSSGPLGVEEQTALLAEDHTPGLCEQPSKQSQRQNDRLPSRKRNRNRFCFLSPPLDIIMNLQRRRAAAKVEGS
jgi:hypothetical protein